MSNDSCTIKLTEKQRKELTNLAYWGHSADTAEAYGGDQLEVLESKGLVVSVK